VEPHEAPIDFPTLFIAVDWIRAHCVIPDGVHAAEPYDPAEWQARFLLHFYRVKPTAEVGQLATAFVYRRAQIIMAQKTGKGPLTAAMICLEGVGPTVFDGWAAGGEVYSCEDYGCPCGWEYIYEPGEPMARPRPTPLIQMTAFSVDQTGNVYDALIPMIEDGPLHAIIPKTTTGFTRLPNRGRIDTVTSSAKSRLGQRVTFVVQDETGIWTATNGMVEVAETQRRGLAGMGGRSVETSNAYDPSGQSVAQRTDESSAPDVLHWFPKPPATLSYENKEERRKILRFNYTDQGVWWVDLDAIEAESAEIAELDPAQAERFYGNRITAGTESWCAGEKWQARKVKKPRKLDKRQSVVVALDGSDTEDWTVIRCETQDGYQFTPTYGPDNRPCIWNPADFDGQVPRLEVDAAVDEIMRTYKVVRFYVDPPYWESEVDAWAEKYGEKRVIRFETYRPVQMHAACERLLTDVVKQDSGFSHDGCETTLRHVRNARKAPRAGEAEPGKKRYVLTKPTKPQKIDACVTSVICHEAWGDVTNAKLWPKRYRAAAA
jgi:hypothetical protein